MSGPSLRQLQAHHAIHDAAFHEATRLTDFLANAIQDGRSYNVPPLAGALLELWQTRILAHAQAEEEGLYLDAERLFPQLTNTIAQLRRDHDLMHQFSDDVQTLISTATPWPTILTYFQALLLINQRHSRDEEVNLVQMFG